MNTKAVLGIAFVFIGCCSNVVFLELVVKEDPGAGNLVTFFQFLFIAVVGFFTVGKCGTARRVIPIKEYLLLVGFFWSCSVANNYAFDFNISMPLHMIFRAGSLMANMVMGVWILRKRYTFLKYLAVFMISVGIVVCTIESSSDVRSQRDIAQDAGEEERLLFVDWLWWCLGIGILTFALFVSARMGIFQETLYAKHGKQPWEALFYTHALPLPIFLPLLPNLLTHAQVTLDSVPMEVFGFMVPKQLVWLTLYVLTQGLCISSVYVLTTECTSLTVTLTVTLRKFVSLIFSILYFRNPFTMSHWLGTLLVFIGTLIFTELLQKFVRVFIPEKKPKEKMK